MKKPISTDPIEPADAKRPAKRVLIVEDDESMATALRDGFGLEGFDIVMAGDGVEGGRLAASHDPDLILLDVMLPRKTGLDLCKELRAAGNDVPIIMLTARGQEVDKVLGLKLGADDYVTKPFSLMELMARVEAVLRRSEAQKEELDTFEFGDVFVDFRKHEVRRDGSPLDLPARELRLLQYFVEHRQQVVSREQLLESVWGYENMPFTRTVDMHIAKLRKKIEPTPHEPKFVVTVHRVGYKFTG